LRSTCHEWLVWPRDMAHELEDSMPEVDMFIGTGEYNKIVPLLKALREGKLDKKSFVEIPKVYPY
jgi:ribosomal protein S12 methylthiotransferase